jgi:UDP-N-acetylmuramate dehydrogenase
MIDISKNLSLLPHNTFGMNVRAQVFAEYDTADDLCALLVHPDVEDRPLLHIGAGSNLLFTHDVEGVVLHSRIGGIRIVAESDETVTVESGSGVVWDDLCAWCVEHGLRGVENLSAIPGECGAAAVQNIGAYGAEIADSLTEVEVVEVATRQRKTLRREDCHYGYRSSLFKEDAHRGEFIVVAIRLQLRRQGKANLRYKQLCEALKGREEASAAEVRAAVTALRDSKLPNPKLVGNAGSFFKNPIVPKTKADELLSVYPFMPQHQVDDKSVKIPAGWLIEQCGWKGRTMGKAGVYEKQSLVLVNRGGASPAEVVALSDAIMRTVNDRFGILIEPEVNIL